MKLINDDATRRVNSIFLGPKGYMLPWQARYTAYVIGFGIFAFLIVFEHRMGINPGLGSTGAALLVTVLLTRKVGTAISYERPVRAVIKEFWQELNAPRPDEREKHATFTRPRNEWAGIRTYGEDDSGTADR